MAPTKIQVSTKYMFAVTLWARQRGSGGAGNLHILLWAIQLLRHQVGSAYKFNDATPMGSFPLPLRTFTKL